MDMHRARCTGKHAKVSRQTLTQGTLTQTGKPPLEKTRTSTHSEKQTHSHTPPGVHTQQ